MTHAIYGYTFDYVLWWVVFASLLIHTWCFFRFFPRKRRPRLGLVLGNVLVFLCLGDCAALAGETWFRFVHVGMDAFGMTYGARKWMLLYGQTNSLDCRDDEWTPQPPPGVRRIAFVGDSFTYGWGIERREERFCEQVAAILSRRGRRVQSMNVAKPGWDTYEQALFLDTFLDGWQVDEVVLVYVPNDIEKSLPVTPEFDPTRPPPDSTFFNLHGSALIEYLHYAVVVPRAATVTHYHDWLAAGYADADAWRQQQEHLTSLVDACRSRGVPLKVVLFPFLRVTGDHYDAGRIHDQVASFLQTKGVPVVDLRPVFDGQNPRDLVLSGRDAHPNVRANQLAAEAIVKGLYPGSSTP